MPIPGNSHSAGKKPSTPTIGNATAGNASASVAFTASTYIGKGTISYTATSTPGARTGSGSSPITVSSLTNGTAYTFSVAGTTNYGVPSDASEFSGPVTPVAPPFFPFFPFFPYFPPTCTAGCGPATETGTSDGPFSDPAWSACSSGGIQTRTNTFVRTTFYTATCTNSDCSTYTSNTSSTATIYVPQSQSCTPPPAGCSGPGCTPASGGPFRCGVSNCCDCSIDGCGTIACCTPCGGILSGGTCNPC